MLAKEMTEVRCPVCRGMARREVDLVRDEISYFCSSCGYVAYTTLEGRYRRHGTSDMEPSMKWARVPKVVKRIPWRRGGSMGVYEGGNKTMGEERFREWVNKRSRLPLAINGHTLVLKGDDIIAVDGGKFVYDEALQLVRMLNSRSPFAQINASVMIWERNGTLRLFVLGMIAIILIVVILLARR